MKKSIVAFVLLMVTAMMLSGCILPPLPDIDGGHRDGRGHGGHNDGGHRDGGGRH